MYRLLARFKSFREATSLLPGAPGGKNGAKELSADQEKIIDELIDTFYLSRQRPSVAALHRTIALECFQASIEVPSYKAVRSRVKSLDVSDVIRAREGAKGANQFRPVKASLTASEPLELVQIDHTLVDVIVVDDLDRKSIGRPWLSVAIDVATRVPLALYGSHDRTVCLSGGQRHVRRTLGDQKRFSAFCFAELGATIAKRVRPSRQTP